MVGNRNIRIVDEVYDNGRFYSFKEEHGYNVVPWVSIYPVSANAVDCFFQSTGIKITFLKQKISSLLFKVYN